MNSYLALVDHDETGYGALVPELETVMANADTLEELLSLVSEGIALHLLEETVPSLPRLRTLADVPPGMLEGFKEPQAHLVAPAPLNPVSLEVERAFEQSGLSQSELARRLGTSRAAVARLMDPFYWGHSFPMLRRVAEVLGAKLHFEIRAA